MKQDSKPETTTALAVVPPDADDYIRSRIFSVRGVQVMLDRDRSPTTV